MSFVRRVVVGVEMPKTRPWTATSLGAPGRLAVAHAFQAAESSRIPVTLISVLPPVSAAWFSSPDEADRKAASDRMAALSVLKDLKQQFTGSHPSSAADTVSAVDTVVVHGDAWEELIRNAGNRPDCLIVCGTRDHGTMRRILFGSTGLKLLRLAPGNVWIVKPRMDDNDSTDIVAATDGGPVGADVLLTAVPLAKSMNARLHVVHAVDPDNDHPDAISRAEAIVQQQLGATDFRTLPFGVKITVVRGDADQCILAAVQEAEADLLVLGTSSKTGVSGLLPGSTVERLLPELTCSVMALKPEGFRSMLPADFWSLSRPPQQS